ncbi:hypothetical protein KKI90_19330 [Xenorhabdus bovienii]|uniref:Uncharacterized protein n=2 Tax=Xenorhabdus bovienii TaxID=40576 RepID=A0AAJ1JA70_XENBV|nr:hypothetical protein [Xenorhabdus bovienii]MDE1479834.1 hypothetical protein [Xenorhabdus bovienii]MDE1488443.1 hypothetical protein [Xenorhabdus bovienii]MDE1492131.1 hypothetical protein [Xenorhabdus bovienii]MDE1496335.1 hypothetical protein [Xenorhabdus bovienii]MDE9428178.1 hypothetical protein [Xenorhabdus bovienii]
MDIEINSPVNITLDVIELDEHIPSMKCNVMIKVEKFGYRSDVNLQPWIECQCFDNFINNMRGDNIAVLKDMNNFFELIINPVQGWLEWSCAKEDLDGYITLAKGREKLTDESKRALYEAFNDYPKWW